MARKVKVIQESESGRNTKFQDTKSRRIMSRVQFVKEIEKNNYDCYYVRNINGLKTPVSKPDGKKNNNLD